MRRHKRHPRNDPRKHPRHPQRGFTLVEMLVTISIAILLIGLSYPVMRNLVLYSRVSAGETTVGGAVEAARSYLERERLNLNDPLPLRAGTPTVGAYKGIALIFAPSGEIRLARSNPVAWSSQGGGEMLHMISEDSGGTVIPLPRAGFEDLPDRDYIDLPRGVRVFGVTRDSDTGEPKLLEPPFAVRFNEHGQLVANGEPYPSNLAERRLEDRVVVYDADLDGSYEYDVHRGNGSTDTTFSEDFGRFAFGVERIETVAGIRIENASDPSDYRYVMFSRYTGAPMRSE